MTVLPRPLPTRFSGNRGPGGLGRGPGGGGNSPPGRIPPTGRPVWTPTPALPVPAVAAVARIPLPVQALALVAAFAVGYAIGLALVQLWGRLAGPPRVASNQGTFLDTGVFAELGRYTFCEKTTLMFRGVECWNGAPDNWTTSVPPTTANVGGATTSVRNLRIITRTVSGESVCGNPEDPDGGEKLYALEWSYNIGSSTTLTTKTDMYVSSGPNPSSRRGTFTRKTELVWVKRGDATVWEPNQPETPTPIAPAFNAAPAVAAAPQLLPALPVLPIAPAADPVPVPSDPGPDPQPAPARVAPRPAPVRVAPRPALPLPVPDARQTNSGQLLPLPQAAPATVPADVHFPWPGGPAVGPGGTRPDAVAIAQEVGRIEQKLALMPKPGPDPSNPVDWGDLASTLLRIWEAIQSVNAAGVYTLSSPCELDEDTEERIVTEVPYDGALSWLEVLNNKVDALAQLQQVAKDLKQPICRHKAQGQPVTVTFVEE